MQGTAGSNWQLAEAKAKAGAEARVQAHVALVFVQTSCRGSILIIQHCWQSFSCDWATKWQTGRERLRDRARECAIWFAAWAVKSWGTQKLVHSQHKICGCWHCKKPAGFTKCQSYNLGMCVSVGWGCRFWACKWGLFNDILISLLCLNMPNIHGASALIKLFYTSESLYRLNVCL